MAFMAGIINVVGILGLRQAVTHLTGTTSLLGAAVGTGDWASALHCLTMLGSFVTGTVISGCLIQDSTLKLGRRYGVALLLESILLFVAVPLLQENQSLGIYCASCASGLQNAMVSTYSGTVVRTTHISGMITDLGIFLGHALRGIPVDTRRVRLCVAVITGFLCGGIAGALAFGRIRYAALFIPASLTATTAVVYGGLLFFRGAGWRAQTKAS